MSDTARNSTLAHSRSCIASRALTCVLYLRMFHICNAWQIFHTQQDTHLRQMKDIPTVQDCATYLGCMVPNFLGTEFRVMDFRKFELYTVLL
jgi:hypothetical protein